MKVIALITVLTITYVQVSGHGAMWEPPGRSSMWRFGFDVPANYDDNQLYCGGAGIQWGTNGGKCGVCGDAYNTPIPRQNENGGRYGTGQIARTYRSGEVIDVNIHLTTAHLGDFNFSICNLDNSAETEECFKQVRLENGAEKLEGITQSQDYHIRLRLPQGLKCKQCSLRWNYRTGNTYGDCGDGTSATGCGPQETFRNCADVRIE